MLFEQQSAGLVAGWLDDLGAWRREFGNRYAGKIAQAERIRAGTGAQSDAKRRATLELRELAQFARRACPFGLPTDAHDSDLKDEAARAVAVLFGRAEYLAQRGAGLKGMRESFERYALAAGVGVPDSDLEDAGAVARMLSPAWWHRRLRVAHARGAESVAIMGGLVRKGAQRYASNHTVKRRRQQRHRNAMALENTEAINQSGEVFTLADLAGRSVANPENRRGELMTRIRGFEEYAAAAGYVGEFWTLTAPARMHRYTGTGQDNPIWTGQTPKEVSTWMVGRWAQFRAAIHRRGIGVYGFRMAEPHNDGTPHWHLVLFMRAEHKGRARALVRRYFMGTAEADALDEPPTAAAVLASMKAQGVRGRTAAAPALAAVMAHGYAVSKRRLERADKARREHGFDFKSIDPAQGGAAAYAAMYVSKNIDGGSRGKDLLGDDVISGAERVEAWKATWGIRQFQQVGGAPVGIWRELRRLVAGEDETPALQAARIAAGVEKSWRDYLAAMGGALVKRNALPVNLAKSREGERRDPVTGDFEEARNGYGEPAQAAVFGLVDECGGVHVTRVNRWEVRRKPEKVGLNSAGLPALGPVSITVRGIENEWSGKCFEPGGTGFEDENYGRPFLPGSGRGDDWRGRPGNFARTGGPGGGIGDGAAEDGRPWQ